MQVQTYGQMNTQMMADYPLCQEIFTLETELQDMLKDYLYYKLKHYGRWENYENLKQIILPYVGWEARHPQLRTSHHYDALLHALEYILEILERRWLA